MNPESIMQRALELAATALGQTWPNPAVGAVLVKNNNIIAEGATARSGRPHAETVAIAQAKENARGATLYVTLEPCSHYGQTPPCTDAIIKAGISKVVIACLDPNPQVNGKGITQLEAAGIKTTHGLCEAEARELNRGFFSVIEKKRPFIALKMAVSKDGNISASKDVKTDITGMEAQKHTHKLRASFDAILTGSGTVLTDDPQLNVRIPGMEHRSPIRIVLSSRNLPANAKIFPAQIYSRDDDVISKLTGQGITRLLIEGGQGINTHFLQSGLVDRIYLYQAPHSLPGGLAAVRGGLMAALAGWHKQDDVIELGSDICTVFERVG
jgi:diaminohydroxyphosphoribosylaminopyrimidine deaminase/5-amino-6-(5-phosphoribosylamino)uracil reductase